MQSVAPALVAAGRLGIRDVLPICQKILAGSPEKISPEWRAAAAFVMGVAGDAKSPGVSHLFTVIKSEMDSVDAKVEAVKAVGNLKLPGGAAKLEAYKDIADKNTKWMVEWAIGRLTGQEAKHVPVIEDWHANASFTDIPVVK